PASQLVFNPGLVFTASGRNSDKGVYVETRTTNGSLSDYPFHLVTRCGNRGLWVVGDGKGAASRDNGVTNFAHPGTGQWEVTFNADMRDCVYLATVGDPGRGVVANAGLVFTASGHNGNNNGVYVETKNLNGELTDLPFHLQPACRRDNARWVVIDNAGEARRGTAENTKRLGTGQWEVTFNRDVRSCTHLATVGDPGDGAVADPGLVFTASGHESARGVFVETKNLGGGLQDFPFHLRTIC
ncbi:MAG TPA: hypothetical protein VFR67_08235, partial [Pilimelia sp.]|nr:hypothetical protein [Pilimelia sp.]